MDNSEYWAKRFAALEEETSEHSKAWCENAEKEFKKALITIKSKLADFYQQFDSLTGLSRAESRRAIDLGELEAFKLSVEEYIKLGESLDEYFDPELLKTLKTASLRVRISRYDAIQWQIEAELGRLFAEFQQTCWDLLGEAYENRYYQTAYEMRGLGFSFSRLNKPQIEAALAKPWSFGHFSDAIWKSQQSLQQALTQTLTQSVILGRSYTETTKLFAKQMGTSSKNAARIITTEAAAISSAAQKDMFKELGCEKYYIVATLDRRTSQICQSMDGLVFDVKDAKVGETMPPFHPHCRTTTAPYFKDMIPAPRIARGKNGKSVYVDNTNYLEWAKENDIKPVYGLWEPKPNNTLPLAIESPGKEGTILSEVDTSLSYIKPFYKNRYIKAGIDKNGDVTEYIGLEELSQLRVDMRESLGKIKLNEIKEKSNEIPSFSPKKIPEKTEVLPELEIEEFVDLALDPHYKVKHSDTTREDINRIYSNSFIKTVGPKSETYYSTEGAVIIRKKAGQEYIRTGFLYNEHSEYPNKLREIMREAGILND